MSSLEWSLRSIAATALQGKAGFDDGDWIEAPYITAEGIRLIQTGNIGIGQFVDKPEQRRFISERSFQTLGCKWVHPGDILICRLADPIGRACQVPPEVGDSIAAVDCTIYRPDPVVADTRFALHWLNFWRHLKAAQDVAGGSTRQRISRGNLGRLSLPTPPLSEQRQIAAVLDTIDNAIRKTEQIIAKLRQIKQGLLHDLLTRGIDDNGELRDPERHPEQFKDSALGRIPCAWKVAPLGELIAHVIDFRGRTPKKLGMDWGGGDIPALSANNVKMGAVNLAEPTYYGSGALYARWMTNGDCQEGDVLVTLEAPLGNVAQVPDSRRYILSQRVILLRYSEDLVSNDFAAIQMGCSDFQERLVRWSTGTTATGIQRARLVCMLMSAPPPAEQVRLVEIATALDRRLADETRQAQKLLLAKHGLADDLLTGRTRVHAVMETT